MNTTTMTRLGALLLCSGLLGACAGAPARQADSGVTDAVGGDNLDVLFATEFPVTSKAEAIAKSNLALRDGDVDKAIFYSVKALKFDVTDVQTLLRIAQLHVLQGNAQLAARAFNLVLAQDAAQPIALQGLGILYFDAGKPEKAREKLELAVAGDPGLWQSWNVLGVLADQRGEYDVAADCYEKSLEIKPDSVSVRINRGYSRYLAGDLPTAARYLFEVAEESNHEQAWRNVGLVYAELGWYEEALHVFRKIQDDARAYNSAGAIALENDDLQLARAYLMEAVRHSPVYFAEAEQNLAKVRTELGE